MKQQKRYFGTDGIRGRVGESLIHPEFALKLGWAAGRILGKRGGSVLIGKDTRISGYMLESALEAGFAAAGMRVLLTGPLPTPGIAYLTRTLRVQAGIVISASHNLYQDNGIKFFSAEGFKLSDEIELAIEAEFAKPLQVVSSKALGKASRINDAAGRYIEFCKSTVPYGMSLSRMKLLVDCAHGATYHVAPKVFHELGAEVIEVSTDPDGLNINEHCGATNPQLLQKLIRAEGADVGIALDGDGDRLIMVDHKGEIVDGDELLFIMAEHAKMNHELEGGVVGTVMSNFGFEQALSRMKVPFKRAQVGDRYVLEMLLDSKWQLGGEPSGHIVHLGRTTTGDGIISALQVLHVMERTGKSLHELKKGMAKLPQVLINVETENAKQIVVSNEMQNAIQLAEKKLANRGRILVRPSGTEPLVRVMVEGEDENEVQSLAQELAAVITNKAANRNLQIERHIK